MLAHTHSLSRSLTHTIDDVVSSRVDFVNGLVDSFSESDSERGPSSIGDTQNFVEDLLRSSETDSDSSGGAVGFVHDLVLNLTEKIVMIQVTIVTMRSISLRHMKIRIQPRRKKWKLRILSTIMHPSLTLLVGRQLCILLSQTIFLTLQLISC